MIAYRYLALGGDQKPLEICPVCGSNLQCSDAVIVVLVLCGQSVYTRSHLQADGMLQDTDNKDIGKGYHSETRCAKCCTRLFDVSEEEKLDVVIQSPT